MLRFGMSMAVAGVNAMAIPLPGPGSILKKYSAEIMVAMLTVNLVALVAVRPLTETVIKPDVAPNGTVAVMLVAVLAVTVAATPLKKTLLSVSVVEKFVPVIVTATPARPEEGENEVMVGTGGPVLSIMNVRRCV